MKKNLVKIGVIIISISSFLPAASIRNQILLIEASENIRLESQQIVKNYLYFYSNPKKIKYRNEALQGIDNLDKQFRIIAKSTKDEDSKDILAFLDYSKEKMKGVIDTPFEKDNPALMLDYSETLLEGAESINSSIDYIPSTEEKMLMKMKDIAFLVERISKYYIAIFVGQEGINYIEMLDEAIQKMEDDLTSLNKYEYSAKNLSYLVELKKNWVVLKKFYLNYKEIKVPNIVLLASLEVRRNAHALELYHSKNQ
jgi:hypothetical protein